jgi:hypothetical protein
MVCPATGKLCYSRSGAVKAAKAAMRRAPGTHHMTEYECPDAARHPDGGGPLAFRAHAWEGQGAAASVMSPRSVTMGRMMIIVWVVLAVMSGVVAVWLWRLPSSRRVGGLGGVAAGVCLACVVCAIVLGATTANRRLNESRCADYGVAAERTVKFVEYNWSSWECLVLTQDGWVSRSNVWSGDR